MSDGEVTPNIPRDLFKEAMERFLLPTYVKKLREEALEKERKAIEQESTKGAR